MNSEKNFLLIFPPAWVAVEPHLACPSLVSQLRKSGFCSSVLDLNIEFMNYIYTSEYVRQSVCSAEKQYQNMKLIKEFFLKKKDTYENKILNAKYDKYSLFFEKASEKNFTNVINSVDWAIDVYKNSQKFYDYKNILKARFVLDMASFLISLHSCPLEVNMFSSDISDRIMSLNYSDIKKVVFDESVNIFRPFCEDQVKNIVTKNYSFVGISINSKSQLIAGLTIANLLKKHKNIHVCIGGGFFTRVKENLKKNTEIFEIFADSFLLGEGENAIVEMAKYISGKSSISDVQGLLYKVGNEIIYNGDVKSCILSKNAIPDFSDYDFSKYFAPEVVIPIQTQRGCYWRKCTFCDMSYAKKFSVKKIDDLIDEIIFYKKIYSVSNFDIIDEAIVPKYLERLCDEIIRKNLNIKFHISLRFENEFDYKFFKKLYKAGVRYIKWGFETDNERIHKLINKGVDYKNRLKKLKYANKAGIMNCAFTFFGFPSETFDEAMDTYNFIFKNSDYIQASGTTDFSLTRHSYISKNPKEYNINISSEQAEFDNCLKYVDCFGMTDIEKKKYKKMFIKTYHDRYKNTIFYCLNDYTLLFLYNCKYKLKKLKKIRIFKV